MITVILSNSGGELDRRDATDTPHQPALHALVALLAGADLQPGDTVTVIDDD